MEVTRESYVLIDVTWQGGFKHSVPCRGYNLKSQIKFQESLQYIEAFTYRIVTQKEYDAFVFGEPECQSSPAAVIKSKNSTTSSTSPRKNGKSAKTAGSKQLPTKASAKTATKATKTPTRSSKAKPKNSTGSLERKTDGTRTRKAEALKEAPAKRKPRQKASEDPKAVSKPQRASKRDAKRTASNGKGARTELREPKVRNVRKPKKDIQGTDNSGEASLPRTRSRKTKTQ